MTHIGLFEGIGGFSLAAHSVGWETIAWCEWNEFGQKVLSHHFPNAKGHGDITKTDFTIYRGKCDVLTGGFPCQPYSLAGKRLGKDDDRHLWPEMLRAIREIRPKWVVGENVLGIVNWNEGMVFDEVQADLEAQGYEVQAYVLPAAGVDAPHRRDRVWFVAYNNAPDSIGLRLQRWKESRHIQGCTGKTQSKWSKSSVPIETDGKKRTPPYSNGNGHELWRLGKDRPTQGEGKINEQKWKWIQSDDRGTCEQRAASDTDDEGLQRRQLNRASDKGRIQQKWETERQPHKPTSQLCKIAHWQNFPTQSPIRDGNDGLHTESLRQRIREYLDGQVTEDQIDKIIQETTNKWAQETIKAGGNAIVPQVAIQIFKAINEIHNINH